MVGRMRAKRQISRRAALAGRDDAPARPARRGAHIDQVAGWGGVTTLARRRELWHGEVMRALGLVDEREAAEVFWIDAELSPEGGLSFTVLKASDGRPLTETLHILSADDFPKVSEFIAKSLKPIERKPAILYDRVRMDIAAAIRPAADILGLSVAELQEAAHQYKAAKAEATERETTGRATAKLRPITPAAGATAETTKPATLEWPTAKWKDAPEKILGKKRGIITFLKQEWEPFIQNTGTVVTRDMLASHDREAEQALTRHLETHEFPEGISIIYPERLMRIASERPELLRAMLGVHGMKDMR